MGINSVVPLFKIFGGLGLLVLLTACSSSNYPFNPIVKNKVYKPTTIAVVAGYEDDATVKLAEFITKEMAERTKFNVMSQAEIAKRLPGYPDIIKIRKNEDIKDDEEKPIWFLPAEKAKINAIQAKLKVDYLYMVWNRLVRRIVVTSNQGGSTTDYVYPGGNLLEYPGGNVLAATMSVAGSDHSILGLFRDKDYYVVDALKISAEDIVDDFISVTKTGK